MNTDHHSTHCISMRAACQYFDREAKPLAQVTGPAHPISFNDAVDIRIRGTPSSGFQDNTNRSLCNLRGSNLGPASWQGLPLIPVEQPQKLGIPYLGSHLVQESQLHYRIGNNSLERTTL